MVILSKIHSSGRKKDVTVKQLRCWLVLATSLYTSNGCQGLTLRIKHRVIWSNFLENTKDFPLIMAFLSTKAVLMGEPVRPRGPWAWSSWHWPRGYSLGVLRRWEGEGEGVSLGSDCLVQTQLCHPSCLWLDKLLELFEPHFPYL